MPQSFACVLYVTEDGNAQDLPVDAMCKKR